MTIALEHLADNSPADRNFRRLAQLMPNTGGKSIGIRFGSSSATWTAAVLSAAVTIPHGLGIAPGYVGIQTQSQLFDFKVTADATNLTVTGYRTDNTAVSATINFYWLACG
jgi:hypothetical protein